MYCCIDLDIVSNVYCISSATQYKCMLCRYVLTQLCRNAVRIYSSCLIISAARPISTVIACRETEQRRRASLSAADLSVAALIALDQHCALQQYIQNTYIQDIHVISKRTTIRISKYPQLQSARWGWGWLLRCRHL